ncbi:MAG: HD-GYP domain-containing protein, partial [Rhodoferax sp.]
RNPGALTSLGRVKQKDHYTFVHSVNVGVLLVNFCQHLGFDEQQVRDAAVGGLLHDIGKMKTPDVILNKPAKLSDQEFAIMRQHVTHGIDILAKVAGLSPLSLAVAAEHHEHSDGGGYPRGLTGPDISKIGQMAAIVDVYDALTSNRVYHRAMEPADALRKIFEWSKFHFNVDLVQRFIQCIGIYPVGTLVRLQSGLIAVVVEECPSSLLRPTVRAVYDSQRGVALAPRDIALADSACAERIVSSEAASHWNIDARAFV